MSDDEVRLLAAYIYQSWAGPASSECACTRTHVAALVPWLSCTRLARGLPADAMHTMLLPGAHTAGTPLQTRLAPEACPFPVTMITGARVVAWLCDLN